MYDPNPGSPPPCATICLEAAVGGHAQPEAVAGLGRLQLPFTRRAVRFEGVHRCAISRTEARRTGPASSSSRAGHADR